jgi:hypothetical protein
MPTGSLTPSAFSNIGLYTKILQEDYKDQIETIISPIDLYTYHTVKGGDHE